MSTLVADLVGRLFRALVSPRNSKKLLVVSACIYFALALLIRGYGWHLRAAAVFATIAIVSALFIRSAGEQDWKSASHPGWTVAAANLVFALILVFSSLWARREGMPFVFTGRESFLTYLAAFNTRDFHTFLIQDIGMGPDPAAHPFFYLNHPNLPSRVLSLVAQWVGLNLEQQLLMAMSLSTVGLAIAFLGFRNYFSGGFALLFVGFYATGYAFFLSKAFDLLWSVNYFLLWTLLYFLFTDPTLQRTRTKVGLSALMLAICLSDWGFFLFVFALLIFWMAFHVRPFPWRTVLTTLLLPSAIGLLAYAATIIDAVGIHPFLKNLILNLYGRLGQVPANFPENAAFHRIPIDTAWLTDRNIAVLPRPAYVIRLRQLFEALWIEINATTGGLAPVFAILVSLTMVYLVARVMKNRIALAITIVIFLIGWFAALSPIFMLVPVGCILWSIVYFPGRPLQWDGSERAIVCVGAIFLGLLAAYAVAPSHIAQNALLSANPPTGLMEGILFAAVFGLLRKQASLVTSTVANKGRTTEEVPHRVASRVATQCVWIVCFSASWLGVAGLCVAGRLSPENADLIAVLTYTSSFALLGVAGVLYPRAVQRCVGNCLLHARFLSSATAAVFLALAAIAYAKTGHDYYRLNPPLRYPFATALQDPALHGHSFVTNNDDAAVWYFTKGWAYSLSGKLPDIPIEGGSRYFADWKNKEKYDHPEYYLCDHSRFAPKENRVRRPDGTLFGDCAEVAEYLRQRHGYRIVASVPDFAIVALR
jgi:hypothetical protein